MDKYVLITDATRHHDYVNMKIYFSNRLGIFRLVLHYLMENTYEFITILASSPNLKEEEIDWEVGKIYVDFINSRFGAKK